MLEKQVPYYVQFYHMIKKMIFDGEYQPGERINETQLAREHQVSKSPIREAIRILEKEGLLIVEKSKVIVYEPNIKDVKEVYFCRQALESFAVRLTTQIASKSEIQQIEDTLDRTEQALKNGEDSKIILSLNEQFHSLILKFTKNSRLQKQVDDLNSLVHYFRILNFTGEHRAEDILNQHKQIFAHIKNREDEQAASAMIKHLDQDVQHLLKVLED
ncbi:GntR family transcriptional regulator [Piscibacillus halophilus]|uniref:GntR family transcriptional regulator n=1 Tax=Piscibacillus halophilus TaxID=571933 RepID=UPI00158CDD0E|nr:GntR family transcriptional regulator [Piscibacillus halophilus]